MWPRRLVVTLLLLSVLAIGLIGGIGWIAAERALHPALNQYPWTLADYPHLTPEPVALQSRTNVTIGGRFFPGTNGATIILSHGYSGHQDQLLPWVDFLQDAGFTIFTYDLRARGASGGDAVTLGALEQEDLLSVIDYLASRADVDADRIGALGVSLGGAVTILAAARDARIQAVVTEGAFPDAPTVIAQNFKRYINLPAFPFAPVAVWIAEWRTGVTVSDVRPIAAIEAISPRPLLIIHGEDDTKVPLAHGEALFAAAGEPKELWRIPGAEHNMGLSVAPEEYERRVVEFFRQHLLH